MPIKPKLYWEAFVAGAVAEFAIYVDSFDMREAPMERGERLLRK
jgi:hypothetical protein